jgi:excisionase family DNA binding protein
MSRKGLPEMFTVQEVAGAFHMARLTVQRKCAADQIPGAVKVGNKWLIPRTTVEAVLCGEIHLEGLLPSGAPSNQPR